MRGGISLRRRSQARRDLLYPFLHVPSPLRYSFNSAPCAAERMLQILSMSIFIHIISHYSSSLSTGNFKKESPMFVIFTLFPASSYSTSPKFMKNRNTSCNFHSSMWKMEEISETECHFPSLNISNISSNFSTDIDISHHHRFL